MRGIHTTALMMSLVCCTTSALLAENDANPSYLLAETEGDALVEQTLLQQHPEFTREMVEISGPGARYLYNRIDLNGDGEDEILVYLLGPFFCGTGGCDLLVLQKADSGLTVLNSFPTSRVPIVVRGESSNGWRDLVRLTSGGGAEAAYHLLEFDGEKYVETGTVLASTAFVGTAVIADELTADLGIPLEPQR